MEVTENAVAPWRIATIAPASDVAWIALPGGDHDAEGVAQWSLDIAGELVRADDAAEQGQQLPDPGERVHALAAGLYEAWQTATLQQPGGYGVVLLVDGLLPPVSAWITVIGGDAATTVESVTPAAQQGLDELRPAETASIDSYHHGAGLRSIHTITHQVDESTWAIECLAAYRWLVAPGRVLLVRVSVLGPERFVAALAALDEFAASVQVTPAAADSLAVG